MKTTDELFLFFFKMVSIKTREPQAVKAKVDMFIYIKNTVELRIENSELVLSVNPN